MTIELLHHTPLWIASKAIRKCWASEEKGDTVEGNCGEADRNLIYRVGNKNKHGSTLEHLNYTFDIDGISRACLQELARHRHASISVKSTRYTLKELKKIDYEFRWTEVHEREDAERFVVLTGDYVTDAHIIRQLNIVVGATQAGKSNDIIKYLLPEAYKTSLVLTVNARSLQNFLSLRTDRSALWEIQDLAREMFNQLPDEHRYLFEEFVKGSNNE